MTDRSIQLTSIQNEISLKSQQSFLLKGWSVTLVSAVFVLAAFVGESRLAALACFPCLAFWLLDSVLLQQGKQLQCRFDDLVSDDKEAGLSSTDTVRRRKNIGLLRSIFSPTLLLFHGGVVVSIIVVIIALAPWYGGSSQLR